MQTLFPLENIMPPGFLYEDDFITPLEEQTLLELVGSLELKPFMLGEYEAKRLVKSYGQDYSFTDRKLSKGDPIPETFHWLVDRVAAKTSLQTRDFAELLVTGYPPGAVINWHRDAPPFQLIAGISLAADAVMKLRPHEEKDRSRKKILSQTLGRRSLYIISGEARSAWQHSIGPLPRQRYSITLRTLSQ